MVSPEEVQDFLEEGSTTFANYRAANPGGNGSGLIIICYDCGGNSETCFGIYGTDDCGDVNCDSGCCCYD